MKTIIGINVKTNNEAENFPKRNRLNEILSMEYDSKEAFFEDYYQYFMADIWPKFAERIDNTRFSSKEYLNYIHKKIINCDYSIGQASEKHMPLGEPEEPVKESVSPKKNMQIYTPTEVDALLKCSGEYQQKVVEQMQKLTETFAKTQEQINEFQNRMREGLGETRSSLMDYRNAVNDAYYGGATKELTMLHRTMLQADIPETEGFVAWIKNILTMMGLEEISPEIGSAYDPLLHEKQYNSQHGIMVKKCLNPGWKRGKEVILKAVVIIAESYED